MTPVGKACICGASLPRRIGRKGRGRRYCSEACALAERLRQQRERRAGRVVEFARCNYCTARLATGATRHYCDDRCERLARRGVRVYEQRDLTAAEIEVRFQRAKAELKYRRVMQQTERL